MVAVQVAVFIVHATVVLSVWRVAAVQMEPLIAGLKEPMVNVQSLVAAPVLLPLEQELTQTPVAKFCAKDKLPFKLLTQNGERGGLPTIFCQNA